MDGSTDPVMGKWHSYLACPAHEKVTSGSISLVSTAAQPGPASSSISSGSVGCWLSFASIVLLHKAQEISTGPIYTHLWSSG